MIAIQEDRAGRGVDPLIVARAVTKAFGGTVALAGLDFTLYPGEIHALLGENGAGKSTFIKILAGIYEPDGGEIQIAGEGRARGSASGIAFIHQKSSLIPSMTVAENFGLVAGFASRAGVINERGLHETATKSLDALGVDIPADTLVTELPASGRALVAIARALHQEARVVVLDEPTATLPGPDVQHLFAVLRALRDRGTAIMYVSHRLAEVHELCDKVTVMRDGRRQLTARCDEVDQERVVRAILGEELAVDTRAHGARRAGAALAPRLVARGLTTSRLAPLDLTVRPGEVVGCTGLRGAGHGEVTSCLYGLVPHDGAVELDGRPYRPRSPLDALRAQVAYVSGDRTRTLAPGLSLTENVFLNPRFTLLPGWWRSPRAERGQASEVINRLAIKPALTDASIDVLSGGNAQKVVLARSQQSQPKLLLLEDPTAGVDVGSRAEFYRLVRHGCDEGLAVVLVSSDYEEVVDLADRVIVFERGRVMAELTGAESTIEKVSQYAMGVER